jgi:predicted nucleic acid-binding Zn ribbon protein
MKKCLFCSKEFTFKRKSKKYCSRNCQCAYSYRKRNNLLLHSILTKCFFCSKEFSAKNISKKYCSKNCMKIVSYRKKRNIDLSLPVGFSNKNFYIDENGYKKIRLPSHPNATKSGYIFEHRFVMSQALGRPLRKDETIHHINGDRLDNRLENLELRDGAHGQGQRVIDKIQYCISYLEKQGYLESLFKAWKNKELKLQSKKENEELCKQYVLPIT